MDDNTGELEAQQYLGAQNAANAGIANQQSSYTTEPETGSAAGDADLAGGLIPGLHAVSPETPGVPQSDPNKATGLNALLRAITGGSLGASTAGGNSAVNGIGGLLAAYMLSKALKGDSGPQYGGYKGSVNMGMQMNRQQLPPPATTQSFNAAGQAAPARRPGSARGNYFTQPVFAAQGGLMPGGIANVAPPGYAVGGTLLRGPGDGLSDSIHATIDGKQPARLADGEFVVPADVVSALGNGSTEAGSRSLYAMMDRIRQHAHGKKTQQRAVKPNKVLPA